MCEAATKWGGLRSLDIYLFGKAPRSLGSIVIDSGLFACVFAMVRSEVDRRSRELQGGEFDGQNSAGTVMFKMIFKVNDLNSRKEE
jgi:hypothetical protein